MIRFFEDKMRKIIVFFLVLTVSGMLSARDEFNRNSIADELRKPEVKLVAVDFYATWCNSCNDAIPKWKKLQEKYGDKGFEVIVISVRPEGGCAQPPQWYPDKIVCDYDGTIADAWHVREFPQAFLWSWQGNLLVAHGTVDNVASAVEQYFKKIPRVYVEEGSDKNIYKMVRSELEKKSKIEIVANNEERKALTELREKSYAGNYSDNMKCKVGEEISANSRLVISRQKRGKKETLLLELFSVEKSCLTASGTATMRGNPEQEVAEAVSNLLKDLLGDVKMPEKEKNRVRDGSFGGLSPSDVWNPEYKEEVIVEFLSEPTGASVLVDGKMICQSTPCSRTLTAENHAIEMQKEKYIPKKEQHQISKGKSVKYKLDPDFALLSVTGKKNVDLLLDGKSIGKIPIKEMEIKLGNHRIEQKDECFYPSGEIFTVKSGDKKTINLKLDDKESAVKIHVSNEKGDAMEADVYVDDKKVGRAPGTFKVPLCSKKLIVKNGDLKHSEELSLKEKQVKTFQAKLRSDKPANRGYAGSGFVSSSNLQWSTKSSSREMNWNDAKQYCANLNEGGHSDWRLPNIDELRTLIKNHFETQTGGSCPISEKAEKLSSNDWSDDCEGINGSYFSKLGDTGWFWSSSVLSDDSDNAWFVDFNGGDVSDGLKILKNYVRCVRDDS